METIVFQLIIYICVIVEYHYYFYMFLVVG